MQATTYKESGQKPQGHLQYLLEERQLRRAFWLLQFCYLSWNVSYHQFFLFDELLPGRQSVTAFELFFDFIKQLLKLPQLEQQITDYALLTQNQAGSRMNFVL